MEVILHTSNEAMAHSSAMGLLALCNNSVTTDCVILNFCQKFISRY